MEWYEWFFDGIGTEIVAAIIGLIIGGIGGFAIGRKTKSQQIQNAKDNAIQKQSAKTVNDNDAYGKQKKTETSIYQKQIAGDNAQQEQTGSIKNGK